MIVHVLRALFILLMAAVGWFYLELSWLAVFVTLTLAVLLVCVDILSPRKKLVVFSGTFLGLLVGLVIAYALSFIVRLVVDQVASAVPQFGFYLATVRPGGGSFTHRDLLLQFLNLGLGITCCYLAISFILQTKDDFRFIIPYVEFSKQTRGARPIIVDTSVIIDGRILDIAQTGVIESRLIVPRFVVQELQAVADSADKLKRNRGRRGLDILNRLQGTSRIEVILLDASLREDPTATTVDQKLLHLARELNGRLLTTDFNLNKVAQLQSVDVININDLAGALRPVVLPGERMQVRLLKPGEEASQGVGYLEDGTMVVVEDGRSHLNSDVEFVVKSVLQTSAGRMIFGRINDSTLAPPARRRNGGDAAEPTRASGHGGE